MAFERAQRNAVERVSPQRAVRLTSELVRIDSHNPPGRELAAARHLGERLDALGLEVEIIQHSLGGVGAGEEQSSSDRATLLARLRGGGEQPALVFAGHLDTVPPGAAPWQRPVTSGEVAEGCVWGLGATDMKSGLGAMVEAVRAIKESGLPRRGDLLLVATAGEEVDSLGAKELVRRGLLADPGFFVIGEPTGNGIVTAEKGVLWLRLRTRGRTAHGSLPHLGVNAIVKMGKVIEALQALRLPHQPHPLLGGCSLNIGTISGGVKTNIVPDACEIALDVRTVIGQSNEAVIAAIEAALEQLRGRDAEFAAEVEPIIDRPPVEVSPEAAAVQQFMAAHAEITRRREQVQGASFATDASVFIPAFRVPMVICGPGLPSKAHTPNEYVEIERLVEAARIYTLAGARYLAGGPASR